jgi:molybdopterin-guanine dinucleotide biosynthesis protein A
VLAGGASRRLAGIPKGLELVGGSRVIDRVANALRAVSNDLLLAANDPDATNWLPGVAVVSDQHPGAGGMAGVEAALSRGRDALVVAWDMPFVTAPLLELLMVSSRNHESRVTVPESESPYGFEPFCAFYPANILPSLSAFLDRGGGSARAFIATLPRVNRIAMSDVERIGDPRRLFFSINTPEDLANARAMAATR